MSRVAQHASEVPAVGEWERVQSVGGEPPSGEVVVLFIRGNFNVITDQCESSDNLQRARAQ